MCYELTDLSFFLAQDPEAELDPAEIVTISQDEAAKTAEASFRSVFEHGPKIELDHYLVYYTRTFSSFPSIFFINPFPTTDPLPKKNQKL